MPSKKQVVKVYLSDEEYQRIIESSEQAGLSMSAFAKRCCLGLPIASRVESKCVLDLMKINADLGRLGGLLKMWLSNRDQFSGNIQTLLEDIAGIKNTIMAKVREL